MPWHDVSLFFFSMTVRCDSSFRQVHMTLCGPVVLDIVQHFVERWNEIKKRKYRHNMSVTFHLAVVPYALLVLMRLIYSDDTTG